jgi:hypothetical protein
MSNITSHSGPHNVAPLAGLVISTCSAVELDAPNPAKRATNRPPSNHTEVIILLANMAILLSFDSQHLKHMHSFAMC